MVKHGSRARIVNATLKRSALWPHVQVMKLTRNMRVEALGSSTTAGQAMQRFSQWLLDLGEGKEGTHVSFPAEMFVDFEDVENMIQGVFPNLNEGDGCLDSCILMPLNKDVNAMNADILRRFPGAEA